MARRSRRASPRLRSSEPLREALRHLEAVAALGYHRRQVIEDWIEVLFWEFQRNHDGYKAVLARYQRDDAIPLEGSEAARHFALAFWALNAHMHATHEEVLGPLWMEYCANEHMGQFFTPMEVCRMMARITLHPFPEKRPVSILDPCCGAGGMLVACCKEMLCEQVDRTVFVGMDLDINCCRMAALNLCFFNMDGIVIHGNSMDPDDVRGAWETHRSYVWGGSIRPYPLEEAAKWKRKPRPEEPPQAENIGGACPAEPAREPEWQASADGQLLLLPVERVAPARFRRGRTEKRKKKNKPGTSQGRLWE